MNFNKQAKKRPFELIKLKIQSFHIVNFIRKQNRRIVAMNSDIRNKIMDLMVRMRDGDIALAKTTTDHLTKVPTKSANRHTPKIISKRSGRKSIAEDVDGSNNSGLSRRNSTDQHDSDNLRPRTPKKFVRAAVVSASHLPINLQNANKYSPNGPRTLNRKDTASNIETQLSNLRLTTEEREALVSMILISELELRSKVKDQEMAIFSSPKSSPKTPSKPDVKERDILTASDMQKRESIRTSQDKETVTIPTPTETCEKPNAETNSSRRKSRVARQSKYGTRRSLTPIVEASEFAVVNESGRNNVEGYNRTDLETLRAREQLRQKQMESELPSGLIQDTDNSLLILNSDDSLDELVIKDFAIYVRPSEPDIAISSLPITEQAIIECNKLKDTMDSIRERFQIKVARDKYADRNKRRIRLPATSPAISMTPPSTPATRTTQVNIIDSENWGDIALQRPLIDHADSTSEEDFLTEKDMKFDDLFDVGNVSEPVVFQKQPQNPPQQQSEKITDSFENIEDLENPHFSDFPSDESIQINHQANPNNSQNILSTADQRFVSDSSFDITNASVPQQSKSIDVDHKKQSPNRIETQHEKDIKKLKELLDSGELKMSLMNQRFEEGVIDLLLRQSDSLWDPIVGGIPISFFIPSKNHEKGLLDTSINEANLSSPLIKKPKKKLPEFMVSLENEWATSIEKRNEPGVDSKVSDDEELLVEGLPRYELAPQLYRKKVPNIMDSEDEPDPSDSILGDDEMNFDELTNTAAPIYDFKKAKLLDDLQLKMRHLRRLKKNKEKIAPTSVDAFHRNRPNFNALFGIVQNELTSGSYVRSHDIEKLHKRMPLFDRKPIRDVDNCQYHLELLKSIYEKTNKFMSQPGQEGSSETSKCFHEIIESFNKIRDGRVCARLQSCPAENSFQNLQKHSRKDEPQRSPQKLSEATRTNSKPSKNSKSKHSKH